MIGIYIGSCEVFIERRHKSKRKYVIQIVNRVLAIWRAIGAWNRVKQEKLKNEQTSGKTSY